ncbi:poly(A) polymerase [Sphingobium sp. B1D7B]|uniref:CCA tRNA nucleotidyltransferase n=1 Tax=unclassified Sphingobium TaxID=2611147 RepID=UPI002225AAE0|nr:MULTISPECIES: CCA tRNA nucleotidyltransferase [unclassified Sphingobium]MCW2348692.1 poly(A) polymerase [Sphingobium sp. B12D2B]MCW2392526.1 poly(A) polymerase [Sphingobium sp. B11D3A]MCW2404221.1 poly(A) polymerase [Sphingobium sp. B1D7B]
MSAPLPERLPDAEWRAWPGLLALCEALGADQGEARFVGGAVRDALLGIAVKDIDIATVHLPEEVVRRVKAAGLRAVPTGIAHGTITAILDHRPIEITTLRRDVSTDGRRATVAFGTDWQDDAARRDFTMNALYADPASGVLSDYFDGRADLLARRVRFIGDPHQRIAEDHLRILRYFRFTARFGTLDRDTPDYRACVAHATSLMALSRERVADEMLKLLGLPDPADVIAAMVGDGVLASVLPEIDVEGVAALRALIAAEQATGIAPAGLRRLAALLPPDGALADQVGARLRLSNKARQRLRAAATPTSAATPQALAYALGEDSAVDQLLLGRAFSSDCAPTLIGWQAPRLPLSGGDLIAMGLTAGPLVARTLQALERAWIDRGFPEPDETREMARQMVGAALRSSQ